MFHDWRFQNLQLCVLRQTAHNTYNTYLTIIILFTTISFWRIMLSPRRKDWIRSRNAEWELYMLLPSTHFWRFYRISERCSRHSSCNKRLLRDDFGIRPRCLDCASPPPTDWARANRWFQQKLTVRNTPYLCTTGNGSAQT
ncbi:hypothetical protein SAMN05216518_11833 [Bacteroidales bacterium KHT7]|nr:hypothetical protein SAMN05216518_11833 [Bacteroidales bacterium KHT7]